MLPRGQRLVAGADHRLVARRGRRLRRGAIGVRIFVVSGSRVPARLAVVVPKPLGSAPVRNRLRRQLQHAVVPLMSALPVGSLTVIRAESGAEAMSTPELVQSLTAAMSKVNTA